MVPRDQASAASASPHNLCSFYAKPATHVAGFFVHRPATCAHRYSCPEVIGSAQFELSTGVVVDARRAIWFADVRVLAVADLHLGYAWAHRLSGQLMPILPTADTHLRLAELQRE